MQAILRAVAVLSRLVAGLGAAATVVCLVLVAWSVGMRYLLGQPQPWVDKTAGWLVVALVLLAAPEAQRRFEHIGVDVAVGKLGPRLARLAHATGALAVLVVAGVLFTAGWEAVAFSRMVGLMTELPGVPQWWIQSLLPVGAGLMFLVALGQLAVLLVGRDPEFLPGPDEELPRDTLARGE